MTIRHIVRPGFVDLGSLNEVVTEDPIVVTVGDITIVLFNADQRMFAMDHSCARCNSSLADGKLQGEYVTCVVCGWQYDITTGRMTRLPALCVDTFEVRVVALRVMLGANLRPQRHECDAVVPRSDAVVVPGAGCAAASSRRSRTR